MVELIVDTLAGVSSTNSGLLSVFSGNIPSRT